MLKSFLGLFNVIGGIVNKLLGMKEREEHRQVGANEEILKQREDVEDAEKRMDDTTRSSRSDAVKQLRKRKKK